MRDTVRKIPSDKVCAACHKNEAHQRHPAYDGQPPQSVVRHAASADSVCPCGDYPPAGTDIKACASCHYGKYQTWMTGTHADLSANMPAKYAADKQCLKCHAIPSGPSGSVAAAAAANVHNRLGVACESCHGPAREHVDFNRQFMASPPLGPEMEQMARQIIHKGKPANACIDCHSVQSHKEHPKYDKT
jgi:hypothetical protein